MRYSRFEDIPVWKDAARLFVGVCALTDAREARRKGDWANQLERAALSVGNNIAEGFELGTTEQLIRFVYIAKGSAGECRSMLTMGMGLPHLVELKAQLSDLKEKAEDIGRQLGGWLHHLRNTDIAGTRHLTDAGRERTERRKRVAALDARLKQIVEEARDKEAKDREAKDKEKRKKEERERDERESGGGSEG